MKNLKEKLKAIYHIVFDKEYIVFTVTVKDEKLKARCALISDNASSKFIETAIEVLERDPNYMSASSVDQHKLALRIIKLHNECTNVTTRIAIQNVLEILNKNESI